MYPDARKSNAHRLASPLGVSLAAWRSYDAWMSRLKAFWKSLEVLGGEHEKVGFDRGPVGI